MIAFAIQLTKAVIATALGLEKIIWVTWSLKINLMEFYLMEFWNISEVINGGIGPAPNWKKTTNNSTNTTDIFEEISVTSPVSVPVPFVTLSTEVSFAASNDEFSAGKQTKITAVDIQLINIPLKILEFSQRFLVKIILVAAKMSPTSVT